MTRMMHILALTLFSLFLLYALIRGANPAPPLVRDYLIENGYEETDAENMVTAIYLGYRAFDTLGETIVLIASVSGVVYLMGKKQ